jgi:protein-S-isoprenylcysteine O-methyltransferase Ste14
MNEKQIALLRNSLDLFERAVMAVLFARMLGRILPHFMSSGNFVDIGILISDGASTFFVLTRRRTAALSLSATDWTLTVLATALPTFVLPSAAMPVLLPPLVGNILIMHGFVLQIAAKLTLRRSFGLVPANRGVKIGGPYRLLRHPMYAGYILTQLAFLGTYPSCWNVAIYVCAFWAQCARLLAEERLLSRDPAYMRLMQATPYRLVPFVF